MAGSEARNTGGGASYFLILLLIFPTLTWALSVGMPDQVISSHDFVLGHAGTLQPDASISTIGRKGSNYWLLPFWDKAHGGILHAKFSGSLERPLEHLEWIKNKFELFRANAAPLDGNFWIVNTYTATDGVLAFIHVENAGSGAKQRIGLAWSRDNGDSFTFLGNIVVPYTDPDTLNVQGVAYIVRDDFFYIYFHDLKGFTAARAPVSEVLEAARHGQTSHWRKYIGLDGGFSSVGIGGASHNLGIDGISHSDAACSTYDNKCYLLLTRMNWKGKDSWIRLFSSNDGVSWVLSKVIIDVPANETLRGYQYATIVNEDSSDNAVVGRRFFIYCIKDHQEDTRATYRWLIDLSK